jgi:hypothetical protein
MAIKVNQFSIKAKVNDQNKTEHFGNESASESVTKKDVGKEEELIQKCFDKVVDYLKNEKDRF